MEEKVQEPVEQQEGQVDVALLSASHARLIERLVLRDQVRVLQQRDRALGRQLAQVVRPERQTESAKTR